MRYCDLKVARFDLNVNEQFENCPLIIVPIIRLGDKGFQHSLCEKLMLEDFQTVSK